MTNHPKIWFLRHGETKWNRAGRLQGQLDSPLTDRGIADGERQRSIMAPILATQPALFASPLGRAQQTARIALGGQTYHTDPRLMEIHAGTGEGQTREAVLAAHPELVARNATALEIFAASAQAETLAEFHARIRSFLSDLTGPSVIVAHGLLGQVLRAEVRGYPLEQAGMLSNRQGVVYVLDRRVEQVLEAP